MIKVYYVPSRKVTREYLLIAQGLDNHPTVELVNSEEKADLVFLFYTSLKHNPELADKFDPKNTVFIDFHDKPQIVFQVDCLAYFKRSWVEMVSRGKYTTKRAIPWPAHFHPISFAVMDEFLIAQQLERDFALTCTIRPHARHPNRPRVLNCIKSMKISGKTQIGEFNKGSMDRFNDWEMQAYFRLLKQSRIIVTCNPSRWEGDHRLWEAFASGALVFVDEMYTPMMNPLIDNIHCIFYELSNHGLDDLRTKILYFIENRGQAAAIAKNGYDYAMKYHRSVHRIDEIFERIRKGF